MITISGLAQAAASASVHSATRSVASRVPPSSRRESSARRKNSGASCSQVAPIPPWTLIIARAANSSASPAAARKAAGILQPAQHLDELMLDRLVGPDRPAEREPLLRVLDAALQARLHGAERVGPDQRVGEI